MTAVILRLPGISIDRVIAAGGITPTLVMQDWGFAYPLSPALRLLLSPSEDMSRSMDMKRAAGFLLLARQHLDRGDALRRPDARSPFAQRWHVDDVARAFNLPARSALAMALMKSAAETTDALLAERLLTGAYEHIDLHAREIAETEESACS